MSEDMNFDTDRLIEAGESATVEFVASAQQKQGIAAAVCALLNTEGGTVIAGISEKGETFAGTPISEVDIEEVQRFLYSEVSPHCVVSVSLDETSLGPVLTIEVPNGEDTPYTFDGRVFVRVGKKTKPADSQTIREMVLRKGPGAQRWERRPSPGLRSEDLDKELIDETLQRGMGQRGFPVQDAGDLDLVLQDLRVVEFGQLTNAADVAFGVEVGSRLPQTRVRAIRYATDELGDLIDDQLYEGPALRLLDDLIAFVRRHITVSSKFDPNEALRQDVPQFPFDSVHEGIVNALVHRDYSAFSGSIKLNIFPDRLEIWNSGKFPDGITASQFETARHKSILVNPDISHVFYLNGQMERIGRGTNAIVKECRNFGIRTPKWKQQNNGVLLTFFSLEHDVRADLNDRQIALLENTPPGGEFTTPDYADAYAKKVSPRQARRDLDKLEDFGFLIRRGVGRGTVFIRSEKEL